MDNQIELKESEIEEFFRWVESTSLFHAIKNDPPGTIIEHFSPELNLSLTKSAVKIERAIDLPFEVLIEFLINSPWSTELHHWKIMYDAIIARLNEMIHKEKILKQLPNAD